MTASRARREAPYPVYAGLLDPIERVRHPVHTERDSAAQGIDIVRELGSATGALREQQTPRGEPLSA